MNELLLDSINLEEISFSLENFPISGITCNPTIFKREGKIDVAKHIDKVIGMKGKDVTLHIQVVSKDKEGMIEEARNIVNRFGKDIYVKIPATIDGIAAMKVLSKEGVKITATVVGSAYQGIMCALAGADYIAIYYSRMLLNNLDPDKAIQEIRKFLDTSNSKSKLLGASFKSIEQIISAYTSGCHSVTASFKLIKEGLEFPLTKQWVDKFVEDFEEIHGSTQTMNNIIKGAK